MPGAKPIFLSTIIKEAIKQEASDILLSVGRPACLKVEGRLLKLAEMGVLTDEDLESLNQEILPKAKQDVLREERQADFAYSEGKSRFRANVFYQRGHLSIVLRYVKDTIHTLEELGLPEMVKELIANDNGLILLVGPTGSGKSTTMAGMVEYINQNSEKHILTIEDPIEYVYEDKKSMIEQREIGVDAVSFPAALRSALREAPDTILLGEMRDFESVSSAITVAETGHLVLSTVHANSAAGSVDRIIDIFPGDSKDQVRIQLADILLGVLNQRLVPRADGNGVILIVEVMLATPAVRNAIRTAATNQLQSIIQTSASEGMVLLDDALFKAVRRGDITSGDALAAANDRTNFHKLLKTL